MNVEKLRHLTWLDVSLIVYTSNEDIRIVPGLFPGSDSPSMLTKAHWQKSPRLFWTFWGEIFDETLCEGTLEYISTSSVIAHSRLSNVPLSSLYYGDRIERISG
jgi:hypothetical protein